MPRIPENSRSTDLSEAGHFWEATPDRRQIWYKKVWNPTEKRPVKRIVSFVVIALPIFTALMNGQEAKKIQEPEYIGGVFHLDPAGTLTPLERQQINTAFETKALGFGGGQSRITFKGSRSPTRFTAGQEIQFVVRLNAPGGIEPDSLVNLDVLKVAKDERAIVTVKVGPMGLGGAKTRKGETLQSLKFSKYGEQSLRVSPAEPLEPGEYVITTRGGPGAFLFGIDPK